MDYPNIMSFGVLLQPLFLTYICLICIQLIAINNRHNVFSKIICSLFLIVLIILLSFIPLEGGSAITITQSIIFVSFIASIIPLITISKIKGILDKKSIIPICVASFSGIIIAFQANPFEYPGDVSTYLNQFISLSLDSMPYANCFANNPLPTTYNSSCTITKTLLTIGQIPLPDLISSYPQRFFLGLEVIVLSLSFYRLLLPLNLNLITILISWGVLLFGLGNQAILLVINHGLQGSVLAASVFMEIACFSYTILRSKYDVYKIVIFFLISSIGTILQLRVHGAFAMATLALLTPTSLILGLVNLCLTKEVRYFSKKNSYLLILLSTVITIIVIFFISGWSINHEDTRSIVYWTWLENFGFPTFLLPASYIFKAPVSRPETLSIVALLLSIGFLTIYKRKGFKKLSENQVSYLILSSIFSISIFIIYLLPPFSNAFININASNSAATHYRLMWSSAIFSPLPIFFQSAIANKGEKINLLLKKIISFLIGFVILLPIPNPNKDSDHPQFLWSKTKHFFHGPGERVDQSKIVKAILPTIYGEIGSINTKQKFLADNLISFSMSPYTNILEPIKKPYRIFHLKKELINDDIKVYYGWLSSLQDKPDWIVQQTPISEYYSPYSEMRIYDKNIASFISQELINKIPNSELKKLQYEQIKIKNSNYKIWRLNKSLGKTSK